MKYEILVENIKCGGCANTIKTKLEALADVNEAQVDVENGSVTIDTNDSDSRDALVAKLLELGYPEQDSVEGLSSVKAKAKSFVSCAIGRLDK